MASLAVIVIVVTAMGIMVGFVKLDHAFKLFGQVLVSLVLLLILPSILLGIWLSLAGWQRLGLMALASVAGFVLVHGFRSKTGPRNRKH